MEKLRFFISEYIDGNLQIETKHIHYAFRDDINIDDFTPLELMANIKKIENILKKENIKPYFQLL